MPTLILRTPNSNVGVQCVLLVLSQHIQLPFLAIELQDICELDETSGLMVKLADQLSQLYFTELNAQLVESSVKVVDVDVTVAVVVQVLDSVDAALDILLGEHVFFHIESIIS